MENKGVGGIGSNFIRRPGLARSDSEYELASFESMSKPGHYFRHAGGKLRVHRYADNNLFKNDATFRVRRDLCGAITYESVNFPGKFISTNGQH